MYHIYSESISRGLFRLGNIVQCPFKLGNICYYFLELLAHPHGFELGSICSFNHHPYILYNIHHRQSAGNCDLLISTSHFNIQGNPFLLYFFLLAVKQCVETNQGAQKLVMNNSLLLGFLCLLWRDTVSAGRRHTNGYELCPCSSRFIFILI